MPPRRSAFQEPPKKKPCKSGSPEPPLVLVVSDSDADDVDPWDALDESRGVTVVDANSDVTPTKPRQLYN